ncbi:MAG: YihY family inner membrane protein [Planctomycetes bacterium]|nr:YihY family inner membrane protein [Planctomycetota bacterium]
MSTQHHGPVARPWIPKYDAVRVVEPRGLAGVVWRFFARTAWARERAAAPGLAGAFWRAVRVAYLATSGFLRDQCLARAAALTYITVLSIVPMLGLSFSVAKGFGFYGGLRKDTIDPFLDHTFGALPAAGSNAVDLSDVNQKSQAVRIALDQVLGFVDRTDMSALGWFGLVLLVFGAIKLLSSIEGTFNAIWGVQRSRSWIRKLTDYLAMLVVAPLFLFTATGFTAAARANGALDGLPWGEHVQTLLGLVVRAAPLLALWIGFGFVYLALPNARTRLASAGLGALVGGTLWQVTLLVHLELQIGVARYNALYSTFAALPVFLMWIHFSWVAVLIGAEVCNAHQSEPSCSFPGEVREEEPAFREALALRAVGRIAESFLDGAAPWTSERLAQDLALPPRPVAAVLEELVLRGVLARAAHGGEAAFLPARDLEQITVKSVLDALRGSSGFDPESSKAEVDAHVDRVLAGLDHDARASRHNRTLKSLAEAALAARARNAQLVAEDARAPAGAPAPQRGA